MAEAPVAGSIVVHDRIAANKRETWLLLGLFVVLFGGLLALITVAFGLPYIALIIITAGLIGYAAFSYFAATSVVLSISGAREVTKDDEWEFVRRTENLAIGSGLPMPRTWVIEDSAPNAFATGIDPNKAHVVVTRGLLDKLEPAELEGVLAHELSHIGNYDIRVMTITVVLVGLVALVADLALRGMIFSGGGRRSNNDRRGGGQMQLILIAIAIIAAILAPLIAQTIKFAISRKREYLADASGALLARNPDALARALEKIAADPEPLESANKATAHLYISNPLRNAGGFLNGLFATHPPTEERVRLLRSF